MGWQEILLWLQLLSSFALPMMCRGMSKYLHEYQLFLFDAVCSVLGYPKLWSLETQWVDKSNSKFKEKACFQNLELSKFQAVDTNPAHNKLMFHRFTILEKVIDLDPNPGSPRSRLNSRRRTWRQVCLPPVTPEHLLFAVVFCCEHVWSSWQYLKKHHAWLRS